jgi:hypothetical protein
VQKYHQSDPGEAVSATFTSIADTQGPPCCRWGEPMTELDVDRDRLGKLLGLLGSTHDGEVAAAGRAAHRLIREAGLTWPDVLTPPPRPLPKPPAGRASLIVECRSRWTFLSDWERGFVTSIARRPPHRLSDKQAECLDRICRRLGIVCV